LPVLLSIFLSPIIGIAVACVLKRNEAVIESEKLLTGGLIKCPFCAELIKKEARVCRYCGRDVSKGGISTPMKPVVSSADIQFDCPRCGQHLAVEQRGAGIAVNCPSCNEQIEIPRRSARA